MLALGCILPLGASGCLDAYLYQRGRLARMSPARLQPGSTDLASAPMVLKIRIYAAADLRSANPDWQRRVLRLIERVNERCRPWPGLRFEIESVRSWTRDSSTDELGVLFTKLVIEEPGSEVDLVLGLLPARPGAAGSLDELGETTPLGRHILLRALHEPSEWDSVEGQLRPFWSEDREVMAKRRAHKEEVLFLHHFAHSLGLPHAYRGDAIMNPTYAEPRTGFDAIEQRFVAAALVHRGEAGASWPARTRGDLRALIERTPDPDWDPREREVLRAVLSSP